MYIFVLFAVITSSSYLDVEYYVPLESPEESLTSFTTYIFLTRSDTVLCVVKAAQFHRQKNPKM